MDLTNASGISGAVVSSLEITRPGSVIVVKLTTDLKTFYLKSKCGVIEFGGADQWGTGVVPREEAA